MLLTALSNYRLKISMETLEEKEELDALLKRIKKKTVTVKKEEYSVVFTSGPKIFTLLISRPFADKKDIERMIPKIPNEILEITPTGDGAILTFR